jgi:dTDP-glucose pyrophosphorylase|tara:strand:+ start:753 stop:1532 length:780 start_codon:yes stop_codon:yes gene_type:complete
MRHSVDNIIVPMAGLGLRFKENNFGTIKPLIKVDHQCILEKSISKLPNSANKIIILKNEIHKKYSNLRKLIKKNKFNILLLNKNTLGQADTCHKAKKLINDNEDVFIHSCDYILRFSKKKFIDLKKSCDVIVFTYKLKSRIVKNYCDFAYCSFDKNKTVNKITEKRTVSDDPANDHMIVGTFWFKKAKDLFMSCEIAKKKKYYVNKELYIANNINILIKKNLKVKFLEVDFWINFGDVHDFNSYIYWQNFFSETNYLKL